jgi:hypothetical protein
MKIKFLYFGNSSGGGGDDRNGDGDEGCDGDSDLMTVMRGMLMVVMMMETVV